MPEPEDYNSASKNTDSQDSVAGYPAQEIIKAPIEPPQPDDVTPPKSPTKVRSYSVASFLILLGIGVILLGVILWLANAPAYAVIVAGIGALAFIIGVLFWIAGLYKNQNG